MTTANEISNSVFTYNAKDVVDYISGKIYKNEFLQTKGWKAFVEMCNENDPMADKQTTTDHIEPDYIVEALKHFRNNFHHEKIDFAVDPTLANLLADKDFIRNVEEDKKHMLYMKDCIRDLLSNCPAAVHFIGMNWFDEPFDSRGIDALLEVIEKSYNLASSMILEEITGTYFRSRYHKYDGNGCEGLFYPLERNSNSWGEWVHIFPNTIKFFLGDKFNLEKHLEEKHHFSSLARSMNLASVDGYTQMP